MAGGSRAEHLTEVEQDLLTIVNQYQLTKTLAIKQILTSNTIVIDKDVTFRILTLSSKYPSTFARTDVTCSNMFLDPRVSLLTFLSFLSCLFLAPII